MIAGLEGEFIEAHMLDAKRARKIPKKMIGRVLSPSEVSPLRRTCGKDRGQTGAHFALARPLVSYFGLGAT